MSDSGVDPPSVSVSVSVSVSESVSESVSGDGTGPYEGFAGRVGRIFSTSEPWWPEQRRAPEGAPNILIVLCDDLGFSDLGCYGSEIPTPNIDRLAAEGLRFVDFHATPMCSPSRASLLTGLNPHRAGVGTVAHSDPGFPGYAMEITERASTLAELLGEAGWATLAVGKWHLSKDSALSPAGPVRSWPVQRGFDRYYGFLDAFTNFHQPHRLISDNSVVEVDEYPADYYLTDDLTDRAISMIRDVRASDPTRPFLMYLAHGAVHAPLHCKDVDLNHHRDRYAEGWDVVRERRFRAQVEMGLLPAGTELPPRNSEADHDVRPWADLSADEQTLFARYMAVYAAMVDNIDQNFGRLRDALRDLDVWDNTIVIFTSDNGASKEGEGVGTAAYFRTLNHGQGSDEAEVVAEDLPMLDLLGGPRTMPHYPRGWGRVSASPFRLYKQTAHRGGHSAPFIVAGPVCRGREGELRRQYVHITDVLPTLLEICGVERPPVRNGLAQIPLDGRSFLEVLSDPKAPSRHTEQLVELVGNRGYYRDGWEAVVLHRAGTAFSEDRWELFHTAEDPTQVRDLSATEPALLAELTAAWEKAAWSGQVFPLDEGNFVKYLTRPPGDGRLERPVRLTPGVHTLERYRSLQLINLRSFVVDIDVEFGPRDAGILVAHGDQGGGYALYVEEGHLWLVHNGYGVMATEDCGELTPGRRELRMEVHAPGGFRWDMDVRVDGEEVGGIAGVRALGAMAPFEGIDVGIDRRSPVSWEVFERHGPFPWSGAAGGLRSVIYRPGEPAPDAGSRWLELLRSTGSRFE